MGDGHLEVFDSANGLDLDLDLNPQSHNSLNGLLVNALDETYPIVIYQSNDYIHDSAHPLPCYTKQHALRGPPTLA